MLAQNFKTAEQLGLPPEADVALQKVLVLLETEQVKHIPETVYDNWAYNDFGTSPKYSGYFNMNVWQKTKSCGTVACIGGTAELISGIELSSYTDGGRNHNEAFNDLCYPVRRGTGLYNNITVGQAAQAVRNYLTFGAAKWDEVLIS